MKNFWIISLIIFSIGCYGCETVNKAGKATGSAIGTGANTLGTVTEGGAEAVQGKTTPEENPYNR